MARPSPYPAELRERAARMVAEIRPSYPTEWAAMKAVAAKLGIGPPRRRRPGSTTRPGGLKDQAATLNASAAPGRPWLDLAWQLFG
ncbi:hypothetical protein ACWDYC_36290, partial [Streptomyces tendae]